MPDTTHLPETTVAPERELADLLRSTFESFLDAPELQILLDEDRANELAQDTRCTVDSRDGGRTIDMRTNTGDIEIKREYRSSLILLRMKRFYLELHRAIDGFKSDRMKILFQVPLQEITLHQWFRDRLLDNLGNPALLHLAFDFNDLGNCLVQGDAQKVDHLVSAEIDETGLQPRQFPRAGLQPNKQFKAEYVFFVKALLKTIREFWEEHGRGVINQSLTPPAGEDAVAGAREATRKTLG